MGNQCACQKIESEEEILSRIIGNMKLREIETKCVYNQFLNCVDHEDMIIDYFLFSNFISQVIGINFYKLPQTNFFENLRKRSDYLYANVKAIGIILILFSAGDENTKINFIVDYYFSFYGKLNEKTVKEFLGYIIDSQTDNCIFSFREIYSYESIKAFKEIYSRNRRRLLINIIYENFESVKLKYFGKIILNNKHENILNNVIYVSPTTKRSNKISKHKRKAESLANTRNTIRNKLMKGFGVYNSKNAEVSKFRTGNFTKANSMNNKKRVNFCMENNENLASLPYGNENDNDNYYAAKYIEMNFAMKKYSLKNSLKVKNNNINDINNKEIGVIEETTQESLKALNIKATTETNIRRLRNKTMDDLHYKKTNMFQVEKRFSKEENHIAKKISFANVLIKEDIQDLDKNNDFGYIKQCNSDDRVSAKFKSESDKSSKILEIPQNKLSEKLNDKIEHLNYYNKNNSENNITNNLNNNNNNSSNNNTEINEISFCNKNSSKNNVLDEETNYNNINQEKALVQDLNSISIGEESSIHVKLDDNKEKKISLENDKIIEKLGYNLDTSKVISVERISFNSNVNNRNNNIKYEKYNKGQCDKTLKNPNRIELHRKNPYCLTEKKEEKKNKKIKFSKKEELSSNRIIVDPDALEKEIIRNPELSHTIFREFLELSFQFFNGDTIRNWLYDNFLREKLHHN